MTKTLATLLATVFVGCNSQPADKTRELLDDLTSSGIHVEFVEYQKPDKEILTVWDNLLNLNCGNAYSVKDADGYNKFDLNYNGNGLFRYEITVTENTSHRTSQRHISGSVSGDPYKDAVLAHTLRTDSDVRLLFFRTYDRHKSDYSCK